MSRGKKYMEAEAWAHSWWIGLFRAGSEMWWPGWKRGSLNCAELKANEHSGGSLFSPFSVSFTYIFKYLQHSPRPAVGDRLLGNMDFNKSLGGLLASLLCTSNLSWKQCRALTISWKLWRDYTALLSLYPKPFEGSHWLQWDLVQFSSI